MLNLLVKVSTDSELLNHCIHLVDVWIYIGHWSKALHWTTPTPLSDLEVSVTDIEILLYFLIKVFRVS